MLVNGLIIFLDGIPFIHRNDHAFTLLMGNSGDLGILLGNALGSVDHHYHKVCPLYCGYGTNHAEALNLFLHLGLAAKSCSVDKNIFLAVPGHLGINRITGGSGNVGYDHAVLSKEVIYKGGFTYVRLSYNGDLRNIGILILACILWEILGYFVQHISKSLTVGCRNGKWLSDSKIIEFINIHHVFLDTVYFIYNQNNRFLASAQHIRYFCIRIHKSLLHICNKHDHVCCICACSLICDKIISPLSGSIPPVSINVNDLSSHVTSA